MFCFRFDSKCKPNCWNQSLFTINLAWFNVYKYIKDLNHWSNLTTVDYPEAGTNPAFMVGAGPLPWAHYRLQPLGGEPSDGPKRCIQLIANTSRKTNGLPDATNAQNWNDLICSATMVNYVCKKPLV